MSDLEVASMDALPLPFLLSDLALLRVTSAVELFLGSYSTATHTTDW